MVDWLENLGCDGSIEKNRSLLTVGCLLANEDGLRIFW